MPDLSDVPRPHDRPSAPRAEADRQTRSSAVARLVCPAELDLGTVAGVVEDVDQLVACGFRDLRLELDRLRFCDVVGLEALLTAKERLARVGGTLHLSGHACGSLGLLQLAFGLSPQLEREPADGGAEAGVGGPFVRLDGRGA